MQAPPSLNKFRRSSVGPELNGGRKTSSIVFYPTYNNRRRVCLKFNEFLKFTRRFMWASRHIKQLI